MNVLNPTCLRKQAFDSMFKARDFLEHIQAKGLPDAEISYAYECPSCGLFHLARDRGRADRKMFLVAVNGTRRL